MQEPQDRAHIGGRATVQKDRTVRRQLIPIALFGEESLYGEVIRENPHAALGSTATLSQCRHLIMAQSNGGEEIEFNRSLQRLRPLIGIGRLKE
ncbi:MAG: hypothetical protein U0319_01270 [Nitrospira sp.]